MFNFIRNHKVLSLVVFLNVVAVLVVILVIVIHNAKTAVVDVYVAPSAATIEINGKKYDNFQSYDMLPGDYHAVISMEGMQTKEVDFYLEDEGFYRLWEYLLGEDGGFSYYASHPEDVTILENVADDNELVKEFLAKYREKEAAEQNLPINYVTDRANNGFGYMSIDIDLGNDEDCQDGAGSCIVIYDATGDGYDMAIRMMREKDVDPDDYEIVYRTGLDRERAY